uniref:SFRICE_004053 n=1 Tax=Spodoptera frugiperda TaxID=7108 RepID=A0A2H1VG42_SPOFR
MPKYRKLIEIYNVIGVVCVVETKKPAKCESDSPMKGSVTAIFSFSVRGGGGTLIFALWKRLTFKRLILTKSGFRNLNVFFKDLSVDTHHGYTLTNIIMTIT